MKLEFAIAAGCSKLSVAGIGQSQCLQFSRLSLETRLSTSLQQPSGDNVDLEALSFVPTLASTFVPTLPRQLCELPHYRQYA